MNFIKTLNELLTKSVFALFSIICLVSYGEVSTSPSLSASIEYIEYNTEFPDSITYEVWINFDFDWGAITELEASQITALDFDIYLEGFNEWYFGPEQILFCNDGETYTYTPNSENLNLWHINVDFGEDGATYETLSCSNNHSATVAIILDGIDRDYLTATYDCYDYHNEVTANVVISNANFTFEDKNGSINIDILGDDFDQNYQLPSCLRDDLNGLGTYDINLMISDVNDTGVEVGLYLRSYTETAPPISGEVHIAFKHTEFQSGELSADSPLAGTLSEITFNGNYSHTVFSFDSATGLGIDNEQMHIATLFYPYDAVDINCMFMAHPNATKIWDADGVELELVGEQEREYINGSPINNRIQVGETKNDIVINPNPARGIIQLTIPEVLENALLSVLDIQGKQVLSDKLILDGTNTSQLDVSFLQKGLYLVKLIDEEHTYQSRLVID